MLLLNFLKLENFLSHGSSEIHFSKSDKTLIDGKSGSGKSAIIEAIVWALYGVGRVDNRFLVMRGEKKATVTLSLVDGMDEYKIIRSVTQKGVHTLEVLSGTSGEKLAHIERAGIRDIQSWIEEELLRASYLLFVNSIAYIQDNSDTFVKQSASKRKELLLEIVRANQFADLYKKASDRILVESGEQVKVTSRMAMLEDSKNRLSMIADGLMNYVLTEQQLETELNVVNKNILSLRESEDKFKTLIEEMKQKDSIIKLLKSTIEKNNQKIKENETKIEHFDTLAKKIKAAEVEIEAIGDVETKTKDLGKKITDDTERIFKLSFTRSNRIIPIDYASEITEIDRQIKPLVEESGKCPSGDDCPLGEPIRQQIAFLEQEKLKRQQSAMSQSKEIEAQDKAEKELLVPLATEEDKETYNAYAGLWAKKKDLSASVDANKYLIEHIDPEKLKEESLELSKENSNLDIDWDVNEGKRDLLIEKMHGYDEEKVTSEISSLVARQTIITSDLRKAQGDVRTAQNAIEELKETNIQLEAFDIEKKKTDENLEALGAVKEAFSQRGIPAVVVDYMVPRLEDRINEILARLSDFRMRIDTQRKSASGDGMVEGLFLTICNESGEEFDFDNYSGGERLKITVAISEALASLQKVGFRIMDETFMALDEESTDEFVDVVEKLQSQFSQILCITHLRNVKDLFENKITVIRTNGLSTLIK